MQDSLGAQSTGTVAVNVSSATPLVNAPIIQLEQISGGGTQARVVFIALAGRTYRVQSRTASAAM